MKKREWHYVLPPTAFELRCNVCDGGRVWWSEYERMIFCFDCQLDVDGTESIFDGPIALNTCYLLGLNFDIYNLKTHQIERLNLEKSEGAELVYDEPEEVERTLKDYPKKHTIKLLRTGAEEPDPYGESLNKYGRQFFKLVPVHDG